MKNIYILLLSSALFACGGGGDSSPPPIQDNSVDINVRTYSFVYQGGLTSDVVVNGIYEKFESGQSITTLHNNNIYGSISTNVISKAVKNNSNEVNVGFELRDGNSNTLLAEEQKNIDIEKPEQLVFTYGDNTLSTPVYEFEILDKPIDQPSSTTAPLYLINLLNQGDVNVFIDDILFQSTLENMVLSDMYEVNLSSPLSKVSIELLNGTELINCDVSGESFAGKNSLYIFAKSVSGTAGCYITIY